MYQFKLSNNGSCKTQKYEKSKKSTHRQYLLKDSANRVWTENNYAGDAIFGGKNFFELLAEMNKTTAQLKKINCTPTELGIQLYNGTTKIIKRIDGKIINIELKYPEILDKDELWQNRRPELEAEAKVEVKPKKRNIKMEPTQQLRAMKKKYMKELLELYSNYQKHKSAMKVFYESLKPTEEHKQILAKVLQERTEWVSY